MRNFSIDIALQPHAALPIVQIEEIDELLRLAFPEEIDFGFEWAPPEQHLTARSEGELAGHVGLLERGILVGGRPVKSGRGGERGHPSGLAAQRHRACAGAGGGRGAPQERMRLCDALL
ncbi:MAG: hypothetical protein AB9891_00155 [Anaerolineaceae bacterium]